MKHVNLFESKSGNISLLKEVYNELIPCFTSTFVKAVVKYDGAYLIGNIYLLPELDKENLRGIYELFQYFDNLNSKIGYLIRCRPDKFNGVLIEIKMSDPIFNLCYKQIKNYTDQIKRQKRFDL